MTFLPNAGAISSDEISNVIGLAMGFSSTKVGHFIQGMGILAHKILTWLITLQCLFSFVHKGGRIVYSLNYIIIIFRLVYHACILLALSIVILFITYDFW